MKVTYIHHSGFFVETESAGLLFDYFEGDLSALDDLSKEKPLYVFASHHHPDHFSPKIFQLAENRRNVWFVLSDDIFSKRLPDQVKGQTLFTGPDQKVKVGEDGSEILVETFRSTDEGVAFWCTVDGKTIYHAGDLNHWYWEGEEEEWNRNMTAAYRTELKKMAGRKADAAFLPLDPRLGQWFWLGIDDFMKEADAGAIIPMHMWEDFDVARRLKDLPCSESYRDKIVEIGGRGQCFEVR